MKKVQNPEKRAGDWTFRNDLLWTMSKIQRKEQGLGPVGEIYYGQCPKSREKSRGLDL